MGDFEVSRRQALSLSGPCSREIAELGRRLASNLLQWVAAALLIGLPASAQSPGSFPQEPGIPSPAPGLDHGQSNSRFPQQPSIYAGRETLEAKRILALNIQRRKAMISDAQKLLLLARELNADAENMSKAERVHKASEIEKLAKSVRDKMTYTVGDLRVGTTYSSAGP